MPRSQFKIGTRASVLALAQARVIQSELSRCFPGQVFTLVPIRTEGDADLAPFDRVGTKGIFTRAIDARLAQGEVDLAVHSLKDLPTDLPGEVVLASVPQREDPRDALVTLGGERSLKSLNAGARMGTSSPRRAAQIRFLRPDLNVTDLRGNLDTRLAKLKSGHVDAIVVALAGLRRIGREERETAPLPFDEMLPCPCQGALGLTVRSQDIRARKMAGRLEDKNTRIAADAERSFLKALGGGCQIPCGALARVQETRVELSGALFSADGRKRYISTVSAGAGEAGQLGEVLKQQLLEAGAGEVLGRSTDDGLGSTVYRS